MPIILDQNDTSQDTSKQLKTINKQIKSSNTADAKWFHTTLTGSKTRKTGFFNTESHTLAQVSKDAMNKIGYSSELTEHFEKMMHEQVMHLYSEAKGKEAYFTPFARAITGLFAPMLFSNYKPYDYPTRSEFQVLPWEMLRQSGEAITFPKDSTLFGVMNADNWTELSDSNGVKTVVKPIVQSYHMFSAKIKSASKSQSGNATYSTAGEPIIYLAVASIKDGISKDAVMHIGRDNQKPTTDIVPMSLIPVDMTTSSTFMMNSYVGPRWTNIMANVRDHYSRAGLDDLDANVHGVIDADRRLYDMHEIIAELSIVDALDSQANTLVNQAEDIMMTGLKALINYRDKTINAANIDDITKSVVASLKITVQIMDHLSHKDEKLVTTDFLNDIYQELKASSLSNSDSSNIVQESLRLLLSQRLHELDVVRGAGGLHEFKPQDDAITQQYLNDPTYSNQQKRIVTTTEPLVIGQAGAGSGKSHTLVGRINYIKDQGEDLSKALVLSFTNISAININQRFPEIRSETLANMFNQIYQNTYPAQQLSQPSTVANSMTLLNPNTNYFKNKGFKPDDVSSYIRKFSSKLAELDQTGFKRVNVQEVTKDLANLIQHNMELTEVLLDAVEQTTLELQPIIIHHHLMNNHGQLNVPKEYSDLNYIITDESQDISTFEYILLLELAIHHNAQLLIVGDGSQTLYEFRNSDPKYMNALESSGVFTTYKLDVNYRSSPEVLTFANQFLDIIEANDIAKIQLNSSSFVKPTEKSFAEAITIHNTESESAKPTDYHVALRNVIDNSKEFGTWFKGIMDKGEQVAIIGWTRKEVLEIGEALENWLSTNGYDIPVTNIMSERSRPMTVISSILSAVHKDILSLKPSDVNFKNDVQNLASQYIDRKYKYASDAQKKFFAGTFSNALDSVMYQHHWKALVQDFSNGNVGVSSVIGFMNREMLRIETRKNAMDAHLLRPEEAPDYSNEKIILSTIHGVKGLEFDHTIVSFNEAKRGATSQESLRMMFVALSRAKKTEYIINGHIQRRNGVGDTLSAMFDTPMQSAFMRALNDIKKPQTP